LSGAGEVTNWLLEGRFFTIDPKGAVTTWSPAAADAFGWRRKDIVGESFVDTLLAPPERSANRDRLGKLLAGSGQETVRTGAAAPAPAATTAEPVADNVVSISDAAGAEEARAQLERARRDAEEGRVEIRSLEGQLEEARREAQRSRTEVDVARQESADAR